MNDDLISRQAVEEIINDIRDCISVEGYCAILERLKKLPPVNSQEPKTGHWIKDDITERSKSAYKHKCDRCGAYHRAMYDYCPSCGAKMVEPQESKKVNCKSTKCENCINHNYCDYEPQESEE